MAMLRVIAALLLVFLLTPVLAIAQDSIVFPVVRMENGKPIQIGLATQIDEAGLFYTARHLLSEAQIGAYTGKEELAITSDMKDRAKIASIVAMGSYGYANGNLADDWVLFQLARDTVEAKAAFFATARNSFARLTPTLMDTTRWNDVKAGIGMQVFSNNSNLTEKMQALPDQYRYRSRPLFSQGCANNDPLFLELGQTYAAGQSGTPFFRLAADANRVVGVTSRWAVQQELAGVIEALKLDRHNERIRTYLSDLRSQLMTKPSWGADSVGISAALTKFDTAVSTALSDSSDAEFQDALLDLSSSTKLLETAARMVSVAPAACILNFFVEHADQFDPISYIALREPLLEYTNGMKLICELTRTTGESDQDFSNRVIESVSGAKAAALANLIYGRDNIQILDLLALRAWVTKVCVEGGKQSLTSWLDDAIVDSIYREGLGDESSKGWLAKDLVKALSEATGTQTASKKDVPLSFSFQIQVPGGSSGHQAMLEANLDPSSGVFPWADYVPSILPPRDNADSDLPEEYLRPALQNDVESALIMRALATGLRNSNIDGPVPEGLEADAARLAGNAIRLDAARFNGSALSGTSLDTANKVVMTWLSNQPATFSADLPNQYELGPLATVGDYLASLAESNVAVLPEVPAIEMFNPKQLVPMPKFAPQLQRQFGPEITSPDQFEFRPGFNSPIRPQFDPRILIPAPFELRQNFNPELQ